MKPATPHYVSSSLRVGVLALCVGLVSALIPGQSQAESLFRARASYAGANPPFTPRSLFIAPNPQNVGDIITVMIEEETKQEITANTTITKDQTIDENGSTLFNGAVRNIIGKLPFISTKMEDSVSGILSVPSFDGLDNSNSMTSTATANQSSKLEQTITCQIVQILPNGHLMIQGHKTVGMNKERQDLYVTGIVNPYFIDRNNQITSQKIANFQMVVGGKGVLSRQQNDGFVNKLYQFFN